MSLNITKKAIEVLELSCTPHGILATPNNKDNYRRIWARDGVISGLTGLLINNNTVIEGLKNTVLTLALHQHASGIIPSNVSVEPKLTVSYGSTAGRVDATLWWAIGASLCLKNKLIKKEEEEVYLQKALAKVIAVLDIWEFNASDLVYTPLGGNWADEYAVQGYTLYDNTLRLWFLELYEEQFKTVALEKKINRIKYKINSNFQYGSSVDNAWLYNKNAYSRVEQNPGHLFCSIGPSGYNTRWDMAGNALALMRGFKSKIKDTVMYLDTVDSNLKTGLSPVFWPLITQKDKEWLLLEENYNYSFKNYPYQFHNGGVWLIWVGMLALGFALNNEFEFAHKNHKTFSEILTVESNKQNFFEFYNPTNGEPGGVSELCYTASGWLLLDFVIKKDFKRINLLFP